MRHAVLKAQKKLLKKFSSTEYIAKLYDLANFDVKFRPRSKKTGFQADLFMEYQPINPKLKKKKIPPKKLFFIISEIKEFPFTYSRSGIVNKFEVFYIFRYQNEFYRILPENMIRVIESEKVFFDIARPLDGTELKKYRAVQTEKLKKNKSKGKLGKLKSMIKGKKQKN